MPLNAIRGFFRLESASGLLLILAAAIALVMVNSPLDWLYNYFLDTPFEIRLGNGQLAKPLLLWINDGLMAVFFLLIGLELKRELFEGSLSKRSQILLPGAAAIGGMAIPALLYFAINWSDPLAMEGWAIPVATDIAFALGILSLLGKRVPLSLKVFLLALAIIDDLGAILIIAVFYSGDLALQSLILAALAVVALIVLNRLHITNLAPYVLIGLALWVFVLKSGVHATLAGVLLAFAIPLRDKKTGASPLRHFEHTLHPWVAFGILPLFAFANAGISLSGVSLETLLKPVPLGITLGLFLGKQVGVFGLSWVVIKLGWATLPERTRWVHFYGVSVICGIGFTMSLFISALSFEHVPVNELALLSDRLGIIVGSLVAALVGYGILHFTLPKTGQSEQNQRTLHRD